MKRTALFLTALLFVMGLQLQGNALDSRISLGVSRDLVLSGTNIIINPSQSVGERLSYSWGQFKYEIQRVGESSSKLLGQISQKSFGQCPGSFSLDSDSLRTCNFESSADRLIVGAPGDSTVGNSLSITSVGADPLTVRIRGWLDLNGDNRPSAFEPVSVWQSANFINVSSARPFVKFEVEPPLLGNRALTAMVGDGGNPSLGSGLFSLTDTSNLRVRLVSCDNFGCESVIVGGSFRAHPQIAAWEFSGQRTNWDSGRYRAELLYVSPGNEDFVLASQSFDYSARSVVSIETAISASNSASYAGNGLTLPAPWEQAISLPTSQQDFEYQALLRDGDGKPVVGAEVYLYLDLKELADPVSLLADGIRVQSMARDEVVLKRITDDAGIARVNFRNTGAKPGDSLAVELTTQGFRAEEYQGSGGRELVFWTQQPSATLIVSGGQSSAGQPTNLTAKILTDSGPLANSTVIFSAPDPLALGRTAVRTNQSGEVTTTLNLSHLAVGSGSAEVDVMAVYGGEIISSSFVVSWDSNLAVIVATPKPVNVASGFSWSSSESINLRPGATNQVTLELLDSSGNLVTASPVASVAVSYTGVGISVGSFPTRTDSQGRIQFNLLAGANDFGSGQIIVSFVDPRTGGTATKTIPVQVASNANSGAGNQKLSVGSFKGYIAIYALNYTGQRLAAKVAGRWLIEENLSRYERIVRNTGAGFSIKVDLYIDGEFIRSETIVTK